MKSDPTRLSVVIPCFNGAPFIDRQLTALRPQLRVGDEVVIADNGSTDGTAEIVRRFADRHGSPVRVIPAHARQGINHARNRGVEEAYGELILLCDADDVVGPSWLRALRDGLAGGADCVGGPLRRVTPDGTCLETVPGVHTRTWPAAGATVSSPTGANCGFRREVWRRLGGFDEDFAGGGDEIDFFYRASLAGFTTASVPDAVIEYRQRGTAREVFRQHYRYGQSSAQLHAKLEARGMPRDPMWKGAAVVAHSVLQLLFGTRRAKHVGVERLARRLGRWRGGLRRRRFYW